MIYCLMSSSCACFEAVPPSWCKHHRGDEKSKLDQIQMLLRLLCWPDQEILKRSQFWFCLEAGQGRQVGRYCEWLLGWPRGWVDQWGDRSGDDLSEDKLCPVSWKHDTFQSAGLFMFNDCCPSHEWPQYFLVPQISVRVIGWFCQSYFCFAKTFLESYLVFIKFIMFLLCSTIHIMVIKTSLRRKVSLVCSQNINIRVTQKLIFKSI